MPTDSPTRAHRLGEHTGQLLCALGSGDDATTALLQAGTVATAD